MIACVHVSVRCCSSVAGTVRWTCGRYAAKNRPRQTLVASWWGGPTGWYMGQDFNWRLTSRSTCTLIIAFFHVLQSVNQSIINHADGSHGGMVFTTVCLSVCLSVFPHDVSITDAARITKLDEHIFHNESRELIYFGFKGQSQGHEVQRNGAGAGFCTILSAIFCWLLFLTELFLSLLLLLLSSELSYWTCRVESVEYVSHDTHLYCVCLPVGARMHVPPGRHVSVTACVDGQSVYSTPSVFRLRNNNNNNNNNKYVHLYFSDCVIIIILTSTSVFGDGGLSTHADPTSTRRAIMCLGAKG